LLGRLKVKYASDLNDKILITDGKMTQLDWRLKESILSVTPVQDYK
tara:strand:- start:410 stop:547 length:138 start_codon:yes stop_codon:yes gene_type:complete